MLRYKMTVEDFLCQDINIDVCDDVQDGFFIAFAGPVELTDAGREHFAPVLGLQVFIVQYDGHPSMNLATVHIDVKYSEMELTLVKALFRAAAGYCTKDDYDHWFME